MGEKVKSLTQDKANCRSEHGTQEEKVDDSEPSTSLGQFSRTNMKQEQNFRQHSTVKQESTVRRNLTIKRESSSLKRDASSMLDSYNQYEEGEYVENPGGGQADFVKPEQK